MATIPLLVVGPLAWRARHRAQGVEALLDARIGLLQEDIVRAKKARAAQAETRHELAAVQAEMRELARRVPCSPRSAELTSSLREALEPLGVEIRPDLGWTRERDPLGEVRVPLLLPDDATPAGAADDATAAGAADDATPAGAADDATPAGAADDTTAAGAADDATPAGAADDATPAGAADAPRAASPAEAATRASLARMERHVLLLPYGADPRQLVAAASFQVRCLDEAPVLPAHDEPLRWREAVGWPFDGGVRRREERVVELRAERERDAEPLRESFWLEQLRLRRDALRAALR